MCCSFENESDEVEVTRTDRGGENREEGKTGRGETKSLESRIPSDGRSVVVVVLLPREKTGGRRATRRAHRVDRRRSSDAAHSHPARDCRRSGPNRSCGPKIRNSPKFDTNPWTSPPNLSISCQFTMHLDSKCFIL